MSKGKLSFIYTILPKRCAFCGRVIIASDDICSDCCVNARRIEPPVCEKCGRGKADCICRKRERYFKQIAAPYYYDGAVRRGIHRFKFRGIKRNADFYAAEMSLTAERRYAGISFDCVVCVPMTEEHRKSRGYNQSELLAKKVAENMGADFYPDALVKLYETKAQHGLGRFGRRGNLVGVFDTAAGFTPNNKTILICDDVSTSGETFNECAKMLYLHGAKEIYCLALALTKFNK